MRFYTYVTRLYRNGALIDAHLTPSQTSMISWVMAKVGIYCCSDAPMKVLNAFHTWTARRMFDDSFEFEWTDGEYRVLSIVVPSAHMPGDVPEGCKVLQLRKEAV